MDSDLILSCRGTSSRTPSLPAFKSADPCVCRGTLNETLRVEREECKADFERIEIHNAERARAHTEALEQERDQTRRAIIQTEERGLDINRLRVECNQHQEARRVAEVEREKALAVSEAELAGIERERKANEVTVADLKTEFKAERDARHQSEREQAASRERIAMLEQKSPFPATRQRAAPEMRGSCSRGAHPQGR